uniref:Variant surface glycoprotein 1125.2645 n=1 Tax=Trypanosoma brucei TaxID=5691 RepID=M4T070_9TRYP|nr:variant surface glycoprotein 1446 [Trypanosoma brucei]APD74111.1 variant surface glycoprotein 1125.2645 [Trypanosoma brucei]
MAMIASFLVRHTTAAAGDDNDNGAAFKAMCSIIRSCQKGFGSKKADLPAAIATVFADINKAHILAYANETELKEEMIAKFPEEAKRPKPLPRTAAGLLSAQNINKTYETAHKIKTRLEANLNSAKEAIESANKMLATALAGKEDAADSDDTGGNYFESTANPKIFGQNPTEAHNCGGASTGQETDSKNVGITLINDLTCLCIRAQSQKKLCDDTLQSTQVGTLTYATAGNAFKAAYAALIKKCAKKTDFTTPEDLVAELQRFHGLIGANPVRGSTNPEKAAYTLGYAASYTTGCTQSDSQSCVNYKVALSGSDAKGIPWENQIRQAILKARTANVDEQVTAATNALESLNLTIWQNYEAAFVTYSQQEKHAPVHPATADPQKVKECEHHKSNKTACENTGK